MSHIKLFESWLNNQELNEGAIQVFPPGNPRKPEGSMEWPGVAEHLPKYAHPTAETMKERGIIVGADFTYDEFIADSKYRSIPMGTWKDKTLPKFSDENSGYDEMEFDFLEIVPNPAKSREPWVKIADKKGTEFMIPPHAVLDILKGGSVRDEIYPGEYFLIKGERGRIVDFGILNPNTVEIEGSSIKGVVRPDTKAVIVSFKPAKYEDLPGWEPTEKEKAAGITPPKRKIEDAIEEIYTLDEWRKSNFRRLDENKINENIDECSVRMQKNESNLNESNFDAINAYNAVIELDAPAMEEFLKMFSEYFKRNSNALTNMDAKKIADHLESAHDLVKKRSGN